MVRHPGISMHKLPVSGDIMGAVFAAGIVLMFVLGIPIARWFLIAGVILGVVLGGAFVWFHEHHAIEVTDLSDLDQGTLEADKPLSPRE